MDERIEAAIAPLGAELLAVHTTQTDSVDGCSRCAFLLRVVRDQARALAELTDECPPWAPSVAIVYWRYAPTRQHDPSWSKHWERLSPLINALGALPAAKLTPTVWAEHRGRRRAMGLSDTTLNIELGRAKELLDFGVTEGMLKFNPLSSARRVKTVSRRATAPTAEEIELLLAAADDVVNRRCGDGNDDGRRAKLLRIAILAQFDSMLRVNEARGLRLERIGSDGAVTLVARSTKGKRERTVILTPRTLEAIRDLHGAARDGYVFAWPTGKRVSYRALAYWFDRCCELAGIQAAPGDGKVQQRDSRAGGATEADRRGARARAIQRIMGHADLATTQVYLRTSAAEDARHVAAVMSERRGPKLAPRRKARRSVSGKAEVKHNDAKIS